MAMYTVKTYRCQLVAEGTGKFADTHALCANAVAEIFFAKMAGLPGEEMHVLYVNGSMKITGHEVVARGGLHGCAVTPRDILRGAIVANASAFILAHNHPSGDPKPSFEDLAMTAKIREIAELVGCPMLDHVVVCPEERKFSSIVEVL